jgi:hypothetical protein
MIKQSNINLSTIFRRHLDQDSQEGINHKQKLINQQHDKAENRTNAFLIDHKYALKLDELI